MAQVLGPKTILSNLDEILASWLCPNPAQVIAAIWGVNQWVEDFFCLSNNFFLFKKQKDQEVQTQDLQVHTQQLIMYAVCDVCLASDDLISVVTMGNKPSELCG